MVNKVYYTWSDLTDDVQFLSSTINISDYDVIVGIARGGLVPAVCLSQQTELPLVCVTWQTRDGQPPEETPNELIKSVAGKRVLLVDDICDSGLTFKLVHAAIAGFASNVESACLHYNAGETEYVPTYYSQIINKVDDPMWLVYPWEKDE